MNFNELAVWGSSRTVTNYVTAINVRNNYAILGVDK